MKLYGYQSDNGKIRREEIEVPTVYLKEPNFEHAKEILLERARKTLSEKENIKETFSKDVENFKKQLESLENESEQTD